MLLQSRVAAIALALALGRIGPGAMAVPLLGSTLGTGSQPALLYDIDSLTGIVSNSRPTNLTYLVGIAFSPELGLYGLTSSAAFQSPASLFRLDTVTGASQLVGTTGLTGVMEGDLAFDSSTGQLYGLYRLHATARQMFTLDPETGAADVLPISLPGDPSAMAFDATGQLYVLDTSLQQMLKIDKHTGATLATINLSLPLGSTAGMAFDPTTNDFYVADGDSGGTQKLYTLAQTTGQLTVLHDTVLPQGLAGLTFVPEPASSLLLLLGALAGLRRRRPS